MEETKSTIMAIRDKTDRTLTFIEEMLMTVEDEIVEYTDWIDAVASGHQHDDNLNKTRRDLAWFKGYRDALDDVRSYLA